jgi:hypothetical protein
MAVISDLDIKIYLQYAQFTQYVENIQEQYHFDQAGSIPPQTLLVNIYPKPSEMDLLLGTIPVVTPWAHFIAPARLRYQRRTPFGFARIAPSLGSLEYRESGEGEGEDQNEDPETRLERVECESSDEIAQKAVLKRCFEQINRINGWVGFIVGRIGQFLQG